MPFRAPRVPPAAGIAGCAARSDDPGLARADQIHHAGLTTLAEDGHLAGIVPRLEVTPPERRELGNPQTAGVQQPQEHLVAAAGLQGEEAMDLSLGQDALGEPVLLGWQLEGGADVDRQVAVRWPKASRDLTAARVRTRELGARLAGESAKACRSPRVMAGSGRATKARKRSTSAA